MLFMGGCRTFHFDSFWLLLGVAAVGAGVGVGLGIGTGIGIGIGMGIYVEIGARVEVGGQTECPNPPGGSKL